MASFPTDSRPIQEGLRRGGGTLPIVVAIQGLALFLFAFFLGNPSRDTAGQIWLWRLRTGALDRYPLIGNPRYPRTFGPSSFRDPCSKSPIRSRNRGRKRPRPRAVTTFPTSTTRPPDPTCPHCA